MKPCEYAARHSLDTGSDDFGDVGTVVDADADDTDDEFRNSSADHERQAVVIEENLYDERSILEKFHIDSCDDI